MFRVHPGILPRCPVKDYVADFPCPGYYKHNTSKILQADRTPCGRAESFCSLGAFGDMRCCLQSNDEFSKKEDGGIEPCTGRIEMLPKILLKLSTKGVSCILQLGGIVDAGVLNTNADINILLSGLQLSIEKSPVKVNSYIN
ncbi:hypothetical protein PHET_12372 [Paragonimus heterotremus]|uniref:Uncharacterized protein n=1 Tax=Paragonimus heterotremus TaxID=100268 RepID=A0A8J4WC92_9TREM|nr:hypothetical protein PHET_12372 [Paragonimus heterotremus]